MSVYRITEFTSSDMNQAAEFCKTMHDEIAATNAESIDVVSMGDGKGIVIAKYDSVETMERATQIAQQAFGKLIAAGLADQASINMTSGDVVYTFI